MSNDTGEGNVYTCNWRNVGKRFEIHVVDKEKWTAIGSTFEAAEVKLAALIGGETGDWQPCFEFHPDPPKGAVQARFDGGVVGVSGANDPIDFLGAAGQLFTGGICRICKFGIGERLNVPLTVSQFPIASDAGFIRIRLGGPYGNMNMQIYSEEFVQNLTTDEKQRFRWIPVVADQNSKQKFVEPISLFSIPSIVPRGLFSEEKRLQPDGFHCGACGRKQIAGMAQGGAGIYTFISEADIPSPIPSCFQIGQLGNLYFCMTQQRWNSVRGKSGTKRLLSRQVGVAKKNWVNLHPKLQFLE